MKLVTFEVSVGVPVRRVGALHGEAVIDLARAHEARLAAGPAGRRGGPAFPMTLLELLEWEESGIEAARAALEFALADRVARLPRATVRLLAPLPRPHSLRDFMLFEDHVLRMAGDVPEEWRKLPVHWKGNPDTVFGPEDEVPWPDYTEKLDYELELGAVVGRRGRPRDVEEAAGFIAGYTIFNDWSARDVQLREMSVGIGPGIGKDFATSLGPCIVTADEFDFDGARLVARVNGERWSEGGMGPMRFSFAEVLVHLAQAQELRPGDVIGSGTVGGGCGMELDRWLADGDLVELEVDGIGVLRNRVVRGSESRMEEPAALTSA